MIETCGACRCEWERVNDWCKSGFVLEGNCPLLKDYDDKYHNSKNVTKLW